MNPPRSLLSKTHESIQNNAQRGRHGAGEVAGGTAAECTAIFCCLPCTVMNIVVLVVYKVPVGLCRKAIHTSKRKPQTRTLKKSNDVLLNEKSNATCRPNYCVGTTLAEHLASEAEKEKVIEVLEFNEMENGNLGAIQRNRVLEESFSKGSVLKPLLQIKNQKNDGDRTWKRDSSRLNLS